MKSLVGCKVYSLVEIDRDFDQGEDITTVESFTTLDKASSALKSGYAEVKRGLAEDEKDVEYDYEDGITADIESDGNSWHWEIQEQIIK